MTTEVKTAYCDDLSKTNLIYNLDCGETTPPFGAVTFETNLETWQEPVSDAVLRIVPKLKKYIKNHPEVFSEMRLYYFAFGDCIPNLGRVARYKRLWKNMSDLESPAVALRRSEELVVTIPDVGSGFVGVLELPIDADFPDLQRQMYGFTGFYFFSKRDFLGPEAPLQIFDLSFEKQSLVWQKVIQNICPLDCLVLRGWGGFGELEVSVDIFGLLKFPREE